MNCPSTPAGSCAERPTNNIRKHLWPFHHGAPLRSGLQQALLVDGGKRPLALIGNRHIGREHDHWH